MCPVGRYTACWENSNTLHGPNDTPSVSRSHIIQASRRTLRWTLTLQSKYSPSTNNLSISMSQCPELSYSGIRPLGLWSLWISFITSVREYLFIAFSTFRTRSQFLSGWWHMMQRWPCLCRAQHLMRNSAINKIIWIANVGPSQRFLGLCYILFQNEFIIKPDPRPCWELIPSPDV